MASQGAQACRAFPAAQYRCATRSQNRPQEAALCGGVPLAALRHPCTREALRGATPQGPSQSGTRARHRKHPHPARCHQAGRPACASSRYRRGDRLASPRSDCGDENVAQEMATVQGDDSTPHLISNHTRSPPTSKLIAQYSVLHEFAVGACSRDDGSSVAKFHRRISVRHVRRGIRCCHYPPWCLCRLRCYLQCLSKGHERVARNGGPCVHAEIAVCQCVATVDPHQFIHGNRPLLYFWLSAKLTGYIFGCRQS